jgi:hypothetical protein
MANNLRNWFVRSERVKGKHAGVIKYGKYLTDPNHPNHKDKTRAIIPIYGTVEGFVNECAGESVKLDLANSKRKGGRPVDSYAQSFNFVLPPTVQKPSKEQWRAIFKDVMSSMAEKMGLTSISQLKGKVFANVHDQDNPHLNVMVSRVIDGKAIANLDQKAVIGIAKRSFTASVLKHCGLDVSSYTPLQTNLGRRQANWQLQQRAAEKATKDQEKATKDVIERLENEIENAKELQRLTAMLQNQVFKWMDAVEKKDEKQEARQGNRINNTINKINELNIDPETALLLDSVVQQAENKVGKKITIGAKI